MFASVVIVTATGPEFPLVQDGEFVADGVDGVVVFEAVSRGDLGGIVILVEGGETCGFGVVLGGGRRVLASFHVRGAWGQWALLLELSKCLSGRRGPQLQSGVVVQRVQCAFFSVRCTLTSDDTREPEEEAMAQLNCSEGVSCTV